MVIEYRRVVCHTLNGTALLILSPFLLLVALGAFGEWVLNWTFLKPAGWLNAKMRIFDHDSD